MFFRLKKNPSYCGRPEKLGITLIPFTLSHFCFRAGAACCRPIFGHHDPPSAAAQRLDDDQFAVRVERVGKIDDLHAIDEKADMAP